MKTLLSKFKSTNQIDQLTLSIIWLATVSSFQPIEARLTFLSWNQYYNQILSRL